MSWLPEYGVCESIFRQFKNKRERDYEASQASKTSGYLCHKMSSYHVDGKGTFYTLLVWFKKENQDE